MIGIAAQDVGSFIEVGFQFALDHPACGPNDD